MPSGHESPKSWEPTGGPHGEVQSCSCHLEHSEQTTHSLWSVRTRRIWEASVTKVRRRDGSTRKRKEFPFLVSWKPILDSIFCPVSIYEHIYIHTYIHTYMTRAKNNGKENVTTLTKLYLFFHALCLVFILLMGKEIHHGHWDPCKFLLSMPRMVANYLGLLLKVVWSGKLHRWMNMSPQ